MKNNDLSEVFNRDRVNEFDKIDAYLSNLDHVEAGEGSRVAAAILTLVDFLGWTTIRPQSDELPRGKIRKKKPSSTSASK